MNRSTQYWVRVGMLGRVDPLAAGTADYPRAARVLCHTPRGLEVGQILAPVTSPAGDAAGELVRTLSEADAPHLARLALRSKAAYRTCLQWLRERRQSSVLMDVEHSFDGRSLYFYFEGAIPFNSAAIRQQLAITYGANIEFRVFQEDPAAPQQGCGDCGPAATRSPTPPPAGRHQEQASTNRAPAPRATGCSRGGCDSCAVASVCGRRARLAAQRP